MNFKKIPFYHLTVIIAYLTFLPIIFLLFPEIFQYGYLVNHSVLACIFVSIVGLIFYVLWERKKIETQKIDFCFLQILLIVGYSALFAVPEEILFRGLLQTYLSLYFDNIVLVVLLSSFIFGIAHILNGSSGLKPKEWNWKLVRAAFIGGLPLGWLFLLTDSLLFPTLLHMLYLISFQLFLNTKKF